MQKQHLWAVAAVLSACCQAWAVTPITIDFSVEDDGVTPLVNGQDISTPPEFGVYFNVSSTGNNLGPAIFDTDPSGPNGSGPDPDLLVDAGNCIMLQSNSSPTQTTSGIFDTPNDSAAGGTLTFDFAAAGANVRVVSMDALDRDGNGRAIMTLTDGNGAQRVVDIPNQFTGEAPGDPGIATIDLETGSPTESPNIPGLFTTVNTDPGFNIDDVASLVVTFIGSGGVSNLTFIPPCVVDADCDDGVFCNGAEACVSGVCQNGTAPDCDDSIDCTVDSCDTNTDSCQNSPLDDLCDNNLFCDGVEVCDPNNGCQAGPAPDCNDSVGCTVDSCNEDTDSCDNLPSDAACDDGAFCNGVETCDPNNDCQAGSAPNCDDSVGCTVDSCNEDTDSCDNMPNDAACDDGAFCNGVEVCDPDNDCQAGTPPNCDDSVDCTIDTCNETTDSCNNSPSDAACDDGLFCNGVETCDPNNDCQAGTPPNCDDGVGCTMDSCNEDTDSCDNMPVDALCDNGQGCDGLETCDPNNDCQPGTPPNCDDGIACTIDSCDPDTGECINVPDDSLCNDGLFCNGVETCSPVNGCEAGTPPICDDGVSCTMDSCNEDTDSCDNMPNDGLCNDGAFCNGVETCDPTNDCQAGTAPDCNDNVDCTTDACDENADTCTNTPSNAACDDNVSCTVDVCDPITGCSNSPDDSLCNDGDFCNGVETCDPNNDCQAGSAPDCDDGIACTEDSCDEANDTCTSTPVNALCDDGVDCTVDECVAGLGCQNTPDDSFCANGLFCDGNEVCDPVNDCQDGTAPCNEPLRCDEDADECVDCLTDGQCDDGNFCNGIEICIGSRCIPGTPPNCDDGIACTVDSCNEDTDSCDNTPDDSFCSNSLFCDGAEVCDPNNGCIAGAAPNCDDGVSCTVDICNEDSDSCDNTPDDSVCSNGLFCDGAEVCDPNSDCQPGTPPNCNDGVSCTVDACNEDTDSCDNTPDDSVCSNGNFCDGVEVCDPNNDCQPGMAVNCDDGVSCTIDVCNENTDSCDNTPDDSVCSDGLQCNGIEICDPSNDCQAGTPPNCDDGIACTIDVCDEAGGCTNTPDDSLCDNGNFCDGAEVCDPVNGCKGAMPVNCDDGVACTVDVCNEDSDSCDNLPDDSICSNGNFCDGAEVCDPTNDCQPGSPVNCSDGVDCTVDVCDEDADQCSNTPDNSLCDNGSFCDGVEVCDPTLDCQPGGGDPCDDSVGCTVDACDEATDMCNNTPNDALCDDGEFCNGVETCDPTGDCQAGDAPICDDGNACTTDVCSDITDQCVSTPNNAACNDNDPCTLDICTENGCMNSQICGACCFPDNTCNDQVTLSECAATANTSFEGIGSECAGDSNNNGLDDNCEPGEQVPTVSEWGLVILALLLGTMGKLYFGRREADFA
ncbi:MAG: IPTL-CTERM sorting domain-containing protein [Phycisphaerae bacterium]